MRNNAINTLEYSGIVTLSQNIGSKKRKVAQFHNAGKYALFSFLADCLVGDFDMARVYRPTKILLLHKKEDETFERLSGFIFQTSKPEKISSGSGTKSSVKYSFIVPRDLLDSIDIQKLDYIGLYSNITAPEDYTDFAALVELKNLTNTEVSASSALIIDWELNISNKTAEVSK
jgi:hypothetical protein